MSRLPLLLVLLALPLVAGSASAGPLEDAFAAFQRGDERRAAELFREAARQGDPVAQYNLGLLYQQGRGVAQDDAQAAVWLRRAAEQGDAKAQNELGLALRSGRGVPRDVEAARGWLRRAAEGGDADALHNLKALESEGGPPFRLRRGWPPSAWAGVALAVLLAGGLLFRLAGGPSATEGSAPGARGSAGRAELARPDAEAARGAAREGQLAPAPAAVGALAPGGKYELRGLVGEGGMGQVFEGFDRVLDRRVAIKRMRAELRSCPEDRERFLREARIVSHLAHPFIVGIHDIVEAGDDVYLVLDFVDGRPLSSILQERKRLELPECARIFDQVCQAVDFAHRAKVLHRDLKPSNIMVGAGGFAKVMDFGLAREAKDSVSRLTRADASGTPAYMAPEQHLGHARRASDVYSLAACLYEAVTGDIPFKGPDFLAQKERMHFPPPSVLASSLPKSFDAFMARALAAKPEDRPDGPLALLEAFKAACA